MDGTGLYYFNARYMDPEIGRFISRDPAMDGANWWVYCRNNPLNRIDPTGLVDRDGNGIEDEEEQQYRHNDSTACCEGWESGCKDYGDGYDNNKSGGSSQQVFVEGRSQAPTVPLGSGVAPQGTSNLAQLGTSFGKMGTYVKHPGVSVNWGQYAGHATEQMAMRNITPEMVDTWVATGKALQQTSGKWAFVTPQGTAVVTEAGKLVTTWAAAQYNDAMIKIVQALFGK